MYSFRGSSYIHEAFFPDNIQKIIKSFGKCLEDNVFGNFDGVACRGTSGLLIAPLLAHYYGKKLLVVRKPNDNSHSYKMLEGCDDIRSFVIIDDFSASGRTIEEIINGIKKGAREWGYEMFQPIYIGCYFWSEVWGDVTFKQKIYCSDSNRFHKIAKGKTFVQRHGEEYKFDKMNEEKFLEDLGDVA